MDLATRLFGWLRPASLPRISVGPIFTDAAAKNARKAFLEADFPLAISPEASELVWLRSLRQDFHRNLRPDQILNHLPAEHRLIDKGNLTETLKRHDQTLSDEEGVLRLSKFYQESYRLYDAEERHQFVAKIPKRDDPKNLWIFKPTDLSKGRGIRILWKLQDMRKRLRNIDRYELNPEDLRYIAQRYIQNPLLLDGRKSEIRVYFLVACVNPLMVLMFCEGTTRLNTLPFRLDDFDNPLIHVTNVYQQKNHPDYDPEAVLKWTWDELEHHVSETLHLTGPDFLEARLKPRLKSYIRYVIEASRNELSHLPPRTHAFGLYGVDLILDEALNPWLTEIQEGPGLNFDEYVKRRVIPPMLEETIRIAFEIRSRKATGRSLRELDAVEGFEWVVNEASE